MSKAPKSVVVVGSGLAGLSAAYEALASGAHVHVLDRAPKPGGNSIKASSGINGAGTRFQAASAQRIADTPDLFYADTVKSAGVRFRNAAAADQDRKALISKLTAQSAGAVTWLVDEVGVELSVVAMLGGHSAARTHRGSGKLPPGAAIISGLLKKLTAAEDRFTLQNLATVRRLIEKDGAVIGVEYESDGQTKTLEGSVVFASGGFAGDTSLLAEYRPDLSGMPSTNEPNPGSHSILTAVGAPLVDMDSVQIHPTGFVDPKTPDAKLKFLAGEMLRGEGGILLANGGRFVNELETRDHVSAAIMALPPTEDDEKIKQWDVTILLDPGAAKVAANHLGFYEWKGLMRRVKVRDLSPETIAAVDKYAQEVADGAADEFGRRSRGHWTLLPGETNRDEEVFVGRITPIVHFTMGGASIDTEARVLRRGADGQLVPIPGLHAAGEITGGIHGDNRLGGSSLLECVVYGRTAGANAARGACEWSYYRHWC